MKQFRDVTGRDYIKMALWVVLYIAVITVGSIYLLVYYPPYGAMLWVLIIIIGLYLLVRWTARNFGYHCPNCEYDFELSPFRDFISIHAGSQKLLVCPRCRHKSWMAPGKIIR